MFYITSGVNAETDYTFRVCAIGDFGATDYSNEVVVATGPQAPSSLNAIPSSGQVSLSWTDNATAETGYIVQRGTDGAVYSIVAVRAANTETWTNNLGAGTYYYRVYATGSSSNSTAATTGPVVVPP
jgi:titin